MFYRKQWVYRYFILSGIDFKGKHIAWQHWTAAWYIITINFHLLDINFQGFICHLCNIFIRLLRCQVSIWHPANMTHWFTYKNNF